MAEQGKTYQLFTMRMIKTISLIACFSILQFIIMRHYGLTLKAAFLDSITLFLLAFLFINLIYVVQRYYHSKVALNTANLGSVILFTGITIVSHYFISYAIFSYNDAFLEYLNNSVVFKSVFVILTYTVGLLLIWIDQQRIQEKRLQEFAVEKERESIKIELNSIQQQFKPHFLFNSLNSINALTTTNPEEARRMVHLLSEFMRGAVRKDQSEMVTLEQEIRHIKLYTDIEKVRFGDRLTVNYEIEKGCETLLLPALILQPLIENAIKYGLYGHTDEVTIEINITQQNNLLHIRLINPYDPELNDTVKGTGYGLRSIEKKMLILYNQANLLKTEALEQTFTTTLNVPQL